MSTVSQGKLVGSKSAAFRKSSTSKPDEWKDRSGHDVGAERNFAHEKSAVDRAADSRAKKEQDIINRTRKAAQRAKETLKMAKEDINEAKRFVFDKPQSHLVKMYDKKPTADLHSMHSRWSGDHKDKKASPSRSEDLLAVHHVLKSRGENPAELPQHKNLGMMRMHEETGTEARMKIKNVARPDDAGPTSEKSLLSKTGEIKTKRVDEDIAASLSRKYGLSGGLLEAAKSVMERKTPVDLEPETDDRMDDDNGDDDVKKESKHTTPKSAKEKKLAALAEPKDKITHKDVLVGRGVLKKEETEIEEAIKPGVTHVPFAGKPAAIVRTGDGAPHKVFTQDKHGPFYKLKAMAYFKKSMEKKEETEIEEAIKPYVSYSGPRPGKSPSATVMAAGEKPHKTFTKDEHGADYKQKAMDYFKKNMKKLHSEEVESDVDSLTEEQLEEVLKKSDPAGKWISDFVHSKDPKFAGKSKKERMKQALGAYYAKQRNEEVEQIDEISKGTLQSYVKGAKKEADSARKELQYHNRMARDFGHKPEVGGLQATIRKRTLGTDLAKAKMNRSGRSGYMHANVPAREEFEFTAEEIERIESIAAQLDEAKPTIVSSPIRGANQDQSGFGVKKNTADYTISDEKKVRKEEVEELDEGTLKDKITDKDGNRYELHLNVKGVSGHKDDHVIVQTHKNGKAIRKSDLGMLRSGGGNRYVSKDKSYIMKKFNSLKEDIEASTEKLELEEGRGRPKKSGGEAEGDDTHKHPIQQLTKIAHAIEGSEPHFEHKDGSKSKIGKHLAKHVMAVYGSMRTSQDKDDFANKLHASKDSMKSAVSKLF
jgi:hypothetical protein